MSATEYLQCLNLHLDPGVLEAEHYRRFYLDHGLDAETTQRVVTGGHAYSSSSPDCRRLIIALSPATRAHRGREFDVLTGGGHSPEQIMLVCRADKLFFSADQVLGENLAECQRGRHRSGRRSARPISAFAPCLAERIGRSVLVLPGHNLPFYGLPERIEGLIAHHQSRCDRILRACRAEPRSAAELVPFVYTRKLDPHQIGFAFGEVLAHVNYMLRRGSLRPIENAEGTQRVTAA